MVTDLREPLVCDVCKRVWTDEREADEKDVRVWIRQWAESVVIILTGRIPQAQTDWPTVHKDVGRVVIETREEIEQDLLSVQHNVHTRYSHWQ